MNINVIGPHQAVGFSLVHLFGVVSGTFQPPLACYSLFRVVPFFTNNDATECFDLQFCYESTSCRFFYKRLQVPLESGTA